MKRLIKYFITYGISGNLLMVLILIFGFFGLKSMRSTFFPQAPVRNIKIQVVYPGASPDEMEESVALVIEEQLTGVTGVDRITSTSTENLSSVNIEIKQRSDIEEVLQDVENAVNQIVNFPKGIESIDIYKLEPIGRAVSFSITGSNDLKSLKKVGRKIEKDLLRIDGISKVGISGFPNEEVAVEFNLDLLKEYGISLEHVKSKIAESNIEVTGGTLKTKEEEFKIRLKHKSYYADGLKDIVVLSNLDGRTVRLSDIATVRDVWAESPARNFLNGLQAVTIDVEYTNDEDLINIVQSVRSYTDDFNSENNGLTATIINDQSDVVNQRIDMLVDNGVIGFIIVFLLLAIFLHYRLAFWVALSIPIAFGGMFILASFFGITINVISLFGMITVIGILVDDGVVVSENIYRHHEMGKSRVRAAMDGTLEVMPAVFSAILTTIIVFSTFFFLDGRLGDFFGEMAFIVIATLLFSLVEGLLILPAHVAHSKALDRTAKPNKIMRVFTQMMEWLKNRLYRPVLRFSLKNPLMALAIPFALLTITMGAMKGGVIASTFFPSIEGDNIKVSLKMPFGTREYITEEQLVKIEDAIWETNAYFKAKRGIDQDIILTVDKRIGPVNSNEGSMAIELLSSEERNLKQLDIINKIREHLGEVKGAEELTFGTGTIFGKPITMAFTGDDMSELRAATDDMKNELSKLSAVTDITDNDLEGAKEIILELKANSRVLGLTDANIIGQVRQAYFGAEIQRVQRGRDEVKFWVRLNLNSRSSIKQFKNMQIIAPNGGKYLLSDLVNFTIERGVVGINHTNGQKEIRISADISDESVAGNDLMTSLKSDIIPEVLRKYPNIDVNYDSGQNREQQKTANSVQRVMPIILILMIAVIVITFRSGWQTLAVVLLIPFGFVGVAWGHFFHGLPISLFSMLGMIALIGILINDSLVFVSAFNVNIKQGMDFSEALEEAALSRFRPILLTSITTIAGLGPLILETSFQAQFLVPMALSIAYGLGFATIIILVILPVLLLLINRLKCFAIWWWYDKKVAPKTVEPAYKELTFENHD